jgi:hypothetical protein
MARRELVVTHFQAGKVLVPANDGIREVLRVTDFGPNFPQRAIEAELLIGKIPAQDVSIAFDQKSISGFYAWLPPDGAEVRVRYGGSEEGVLEERFSHAGVRPLAKGCQRDAKKR